MSFEVQGRRCDQVKEPREFIVAHEIPGILSVRFPCPGERRVRKVVTRSRARRTQKYPSWKMDRMIECESFNELVAARIYDLDPNVVSYHEQAIAIRYRMADEEREHIPDFVVRRPDCVDIDEIKDKRDEDDPEIIERSSFLTPLLASLGLRYRVRFIEKERHKQTLAFCRSVLKFGRSNLTQIEREAARRLFELVSDITWGDIQKGCLGERGTYIASRLLLEGEIFVADCNAALQEHTLLLRPTEARGRRDLWGA